MVNKLKKIHYIYFLIFSAYLLPRITSLGNDIYNIDANFWFDRSQNFIDAIISNNLTDTYQQYHPGVTLMWITGIPLTLFKLLFEAKFGHSPFLYANHFISAQIAALLPLMTILSILGLLIFHFLRKLTNTNYAIIFSLMLSFEPFFLGTTRFMHVTGLLAMSSFLSSILLLNYLKEQKRAYFYFFSIIMGLALLTKINALVFWGLNIITMIGYLYLTNKNYISIIKTATFSCLITISTFVLLWPTMWVAPIETLKKIFNDGILRTALEENLETPVKSILGFKYLFYTEINLYRLSGFVTILLLLTLVISFKYKKEITTFFKKNIWFRNTLLMAITYYLIYYLSLSIPTKLKDRYIVVYIPFVILIASYTYFFIYNKLNQIGQLSLIIITVIYYLFVAYINYPVFSFYYSELLGGANGINNLGYTVIDRGEYYLQAANYLNNIEGVNPEELNVVVYGGSIIKTFQPAFKGKSINKAGFLDGNESGDYWLTPNYKEHLDYVPYNYCTLDKEFGPRAPQSYPIVKLYKCNGIDNTYRDPKAD